MTEEQRYAAFEKFHKANPDVWELFLEFAFVAINRGRKVGARLIGERIRWQKLIVIRRTEKKFKLNNNHLPFYARKFVERFPEHAGLFEIRERSNGRDEEID